MLVDLSDPPAFYKQFLSTEAFTTKIQVPSCFIKENKKILSKACLLKTDESRNSWETKIVRQKANNYFICEGEWPQFVLHHQLKHGDVLLFFLIEKSTFRVQLYTQKCCRNINEEKLFYEELSSSSSSEEEIGPSLRNSKRARKVEYEEENVDTSSSNEDDPPHDSQRETYYKNPKLEKASSDDDEDKEADSEREAEEYGPKKFRGCNTTSVMNFRSNNPYYEMVVKRSHTTFMTMPMRFAKRTGVINMKKMRLINEDCKKWRAKIVQNCGIIPITRGWAAFRTDNKIECGDTCRFKLIRENVLQVQKVPNNPSLHYYY